MKLTEGTVDHITLEVVRNRLESIVREMGEVILRTARSSVAHHGRDFSCGIFNQRAEMLAIGTSIAIHIIPVIYHLRYLIEHFKGDVRPGDIYIGNDPWEGGLHPNDILVAVPVFHEGELVAFAADRVHHYDVGGMVPGSISGTAREMYQEGLRIPLMRLGRNHQVDMNVMELILHNVRVPHEMRGDLWAQVASSQVGAQRITSLMDRYGKEETQNIWAEILNAYERRSRTLISQLPRCTLFHEGYLDSDGVNVGQLPIRTKITIGENSITVDYTGSSPQTGGPNNVTLPMGASYGFMGVKAALDPSGPINSGYLRPIETIVPEGSILNARRPAAAGGQEQVGQAAIYAMVALSKLIPERVSAEEGSSTHHMTCAGIDHREDEPKPFIFYESVPGGGGARCDKDGMDYIRPIRSGNTNARGLELLEKRYPLVFLRSELRQDSGGPGQYRGGLGVVREYRTSSDGSFSLMGEHAIIPPAGVFGGYSGAPARFEVVRRGEILPISPEFGSKAAAFPLETDDIVRISSQGGGGWGDPLEREPQRVLEDVADGRVSVDQAYQVYGVVIDQDTLAEDAKATESARSTLAAQRIYLRPQKSGAPVYQEGMRVAGISQTFAEGQGYKAGDMIEAHLPNHPSPLRLRIEVHTGLPESKILLDEEIWRELELQDDQRILLRPLRSS